MIIVDASRENVNELTHLGLLLWPDHKWEDLKEEFIELLSSSKDKIYLSFEDQDYIGFIHLSIRSDYVEGSNSSPVGYVEGIYVKPRYRRRGMSRKLIQIGEQWCKAQGCTQIASDIELPNRSSYDFHVCVGFKEANWIIAFIKDISR